MKKTILVFGTIAGVFIATMMMVSIVMMMNKNGSSEHSMWWGYTTMLLGFSMIFVAIKSYRDRYQGGIISFGRAFQIGLFISLIATLFYTVTWVIVYKNFYPDFLEQYSAAEVAKMKAKGATAAAISSMEEEMKSMSEIYHTWWGLVGFTIIEILPVGLVMSLVGALIFKKNKSARLADYRG